MSDIPMTFFFAFQPPNASRNALFRTANSTFHMGASSGPTLMSNQSESALRLEPFSTMKGRLSMTFFTYSSSASLICSGDSHIFNRFTVRYSSLLQALRMLRALGNCCLCFSPCLLLIMTVSTLLYAICMHGVGVEPLGS